GDCALGLPYPKVRSGELAPKIYPLNAPSYPDVLCLRLWLMDDRFDHEKEAIRKVPSMASCASARA
ncbi:MAG TPA: hypothetical protein P5267_03730, partial [Patescibacteria group bacterium]|nr:hypothetical protein [Patescibacteria group bacterium]